MTSISKSLKRSKKTGRGTASFRDSPHFFRPPFVFAVWTAWSILGVYAPCSGQEPVHFNTEVMAVLSRAGCNAGACHGNLNGKNGFKLSLRGQDAAADYLALSRDMLGRRIDPQH